MICFGLICCIISVEMAHNMILGGGRPPSPPRRPPLVGGRGSDSAAGKETR